MSIIHKTLAFPATRMLAAYVFTLFFLLLCIQLLPPGNAYLAVALALSVYVILPGLVHYMRVATIPGVLQPC